MITPVYTPDMRVVTHLPFAPDERRSFTRIPAPEPVPSVVEFKVDTSLPRPTYNEVIELQHFWVQSLEGDHLAFLVAEKDLPLLQRFDQAFTELQVAFLHRRIEERVGKPRADFIMELLA